MLSSHSSPQESSSLFSSNISHYTYFINRTREESSEGSSESESSLSSDPNQSKHFTKSLSIECIKQVVLSIQEIANATFHTGINTTSSEDSFVNEFHACQFQSIQQFYLTFIEKYKKVLGASIFFNRELLNKSMGNLDSMKLEIMPNLFNISIDPSKIRNRDNNSYYEYYFLIKDNLLNKTWSFYCRYSKLLHFHKELCKEMKINGFLMKYQCKLPQFPKKKWFGNKNKEFIKIRGKGLLNYLYEVMHNKACLEEGSLKNFLFNESKKQWEEDQNTHYKIIPWDQIANIHYSTSLDFNDLKAKIYGELENMQKVFDNIVKEEYGIEKNVAIPILKQFISD